MDVRPSLGERGIGIGVRDVFALEERNVTVCTMNIFLYMRDPKRWVMSVKLYGGFGRK